MKMLDAGEKIKRLRKEIGLKQEDLTSDEVTRSLISMIENNKRSLTYKTAKIIASNLNQYYHNLGREITVDFLLESKPQQAERLIREELDKLQGLIDHPPLETGILVEESIQKLINFAKEWELDWIIAQLHEARGKFYHKTYQYNQALKDLFIAQEYYLKEQVYEQVAAVYNSIGVAYYGLMLFEQSLLYYTQAQKVIANHNLTNCDKLKMDLIYNKLLCHRRLRQYDLAFVEISNYRKLDHSNKRHYLRILLVEANTFSDLGNYDKAISIYERLLTKYNKQLTDLTLLVYINYADALRRKGAYEESLEKINVALNLKDADNPGYRIELLLSSAQLHLILKNYKQSIELINQGLFSAEKINNMNLTIELHLLHSKVLTEQGEYLAAKAILDKLETFIKGEDPFSDKLMDIQIHFLLLYSQAENLGQCVDHIQKIYDLRKMIS